MRVRQWALAATAVVTLGAFAGCGGDSPGTPTGAGTTPPGTPILGASSGAATTPAAKPTTKKPAAPPSAPLTCEMVKNSSIGSASLKYEGYDGVPLTEGIWAGEDGNSIEVSACAVGDLDNDGSVDAIAAVMLNGGGTGRFWSLAFWHNAGGTPKYTAGRALGDRNPVESIAVSAEKATVVWLTRGASDPAIALTIRRTSIVAVSGQKINEVAHTDEPYTP